MGTIIVIVVVVDLNGNPVSGVLVTFVVSSGEGTVFPTQPIPTDINGIAKVIRWQMGPMAGMNTLTATSPGLMHSPVVFTATASEDPAKIAYAQFIHNAPIDEVDILVQNKNIGERLTYPSATPFVSLISETLVDIVVRTSFHHQELIRLEDVILKTDTSYLFLLQGGSDGKPLEFNVVDYARKNATQSDALQMITSHGITNVPHVTLERISITTPRTVEQVYVVNIPYGSAGFYITYPTPSYTIFRLRQYEQVLGQYLFDLNEYEGKAITLVGTGRLGGLGAMSIMLLGFDAEGKKIIPEVTTSDNEILGPNEPTPVNFAVYGNYPNPFNTTTTLYFDLPEPANIRLEISDILGRNVKSVTSQTMSAGAKKVLVIDTKNLTSGIYMYSLIAKGITRTYVYNGKFTLRK